jgi:hypothetical protein
MLQNLKINNNEMVVEFPRFKKFKLKMCYVPREDLATIRQQSSSIGFSKVTRAREETVDTDKFMDSYIKKAIKGWEGLTMDIVSSLVPVQISEKELNDVVPYSHEDAMWLVRNSTEFDSFISDTMNQVDLFTVRNKEEQIKK